MVPDDRPALNMQNVAPASAMRCGPWRLVLTEYILFEPRAQIGDRGSDAGKMPAAASARARPARTSTFSAPTGLPGSAYHTADSN